MISYSQLVAKTMPPEKKQTASRCIVGHYLVRPISNIMTIPLISLGTNPTTITQISGLFAIFAFIGFLLLPGDLGFWLGWLSIFVWNVLDGVDGNIARYCEKTSGRGGVWDATVGWLAMVAFYSGMGFVTYYSYGNSIVDNYFPSFSYIVMGDLAGMCWIFPRLVMHKAINTIGKESAKGIQDRQNFGLGKLVFFNVTSINGLAAVIFAICYLCGFMSICTCFYFIISMIVACGSLFKLLK